MSKLIETQIGLLFEGIKKAVEENRAKAPLQPGKMSLLSMFRHSYENSHSDVIAYLLNPNAEHKHRDEYLRLFLQQVGFTHLLEFDLSKTKVYRESGRIDVYLEHPEFSIIIENKIYAWDQEEQLKRYNDLVTRGWGVSQNKVYILYLTLDGYAPSEYSTASDKNLEELIEDDRMVCISYRSEILYWLKQLSFKSNEHTLRSAIEQYIYTVEILTNQTEKEMSKIELVQKEIEKIMSDPNSGELLELVEAAIRNCIDQKTQKYLSEFRASKWQSIAFKNFPKDKMGTLAIDISPSLSHTQVEVFLRTFDYTNTLKLQKYLKDGSINMTFDESRNRLTQKFHSSEENDMIQFCHKIIEILEKCLEKDILAIQIDE